MNTKENKNPASINGNDDCLEHFDGKNNSSLTGLSSERQCEEMRSIVNNEQSSVYLRDGKLYAKEPAITSVAERTGAQWPVTNNKSVHIMLKLVVLTFYVFFLIARGDPYPMAITTALLLVFGVSMLVESVWQVYSFEKLRKGDETHNMAPTRNVAIIVTAVAILVEFAFIGLAVYEFVLSRMFSEPGVMEKVIALVSGLASGIPLIVMSGIYGLSKGTRKFCEEHVIANVQTNRKNTNYLQKLSVFVLMLVMSAGTNVAVAKSPDAVFFLLDGSDSINRDGRKNQIAGVLSKTCMTIQGNPSTKFFLIQIGRKSSLLYEGKVDTHNMSVIAGIVRHLEYNQQSTNIIDGLQQVGKIADPNSEITIIIGSDGLHTGDRSQTEAYAALLKLNQKLKSKAIKLRDMSILGADASVRLGWREASRKAFGSETKMTISGFTDLQTGVKEVIDRLR